MSQRTQTTSPYIAFTRTSHCFRKALDVAKTTDILIGRKKEVSFIYNTLQNIISTKNRSCVNCPDGNLQSYMQHNSSRNGKSDAQSSFVSWALAALEL